MCFSQCWLEVWAQILCCIQRFLCSKRSLEDIVSGCLNIPSLSMWPHVMHTHTFTHCKSYLNDLKTIVRSKQAAELTSVRSGALLQSCLGSRAFFFFFPNNTVTPLVKYFKHKGFYSFSAEGFTQNFHITIACVPVA